MLSLGEFRKGCSYGEAGGPLPVRTERQTLIAVVRYGGGVR